MKKKLKIAILIERTKLNYFLYEFIEYLIGNEMFESPLLILYKKKNKRKYRNKNLILYFLNKALLFIIFSLESLLFLKTSLKFLKVFSIKNISRIKILILENNVDDFKEKNILNQSDLIKLRNENIDLIISGSALFLKEEILIHSRFGAIIFNPFCDFNNLFNLFSLRDILNRKNTINIEIFSFKSTNKNLGIIFKGKVCPKQTWLLTRLFLSKKSVIFLKKILEKLFYERNLPKTIPNISLKYFYHDNFLDQTWLLVNYISNTLVRKIINSFINKLRGKKINRWSIAYSKSKPLENSLKDYCEVPNLKGRFFADPFLFNFNDKNYIFVEDYFFNEEKGKISVLSISDTGEKFLGVVLEEHFHLSFPYVFREGGKIYMVPESCQSNQIRLYECLDFPMKWVHKFTLMNNVSAVDTILIKKKNVWYLLTNICSAKINDHCSELHIFYSDNLFTNKWIPIKMGNPVIFNSLKARNGGIFEKGGDIYRVNQVLNLNGYGNAFDINIIENLNENTYLEKKIKRINPHFFNNISGTHHFHSNMNFSVLDFHRKIFEKDIFKDF